MEEIRVILRFRIPGGSAKGAANSVVHERVQKNALIFMRTMNWTQLHDK